MKAERYADIYTIVSQALDLESGKRKAYIDEKTGGDVVLRGEVEEALASTLLAETAGFLECSPVSTQEGEPVDGFIGANINGYRIIECIGHGGQGDVYRAISTGELKNQVAIKILRSELNTEQILRRYQQEIRIYESLGEHPNIARVYSAGKTGHNRPFFVMEYVDGQPIDDYCDERKLSLRDRATLLLVIFEALKHAHGNLVIHRDIKPHNILVTRDGIPKLLDFGIAKLLEADADGVRKEQSWTVHPALTPEYASPEQVEGDRMLGIATDVYSLGVVLYELLTGHLPYEIKGPRLEEQLRVVREEMPIPPEKVIARSATGKSEGAQKTTLTPQDIAARRGTSEGPLRRELSKDIKIILLYALRKEPDRRYRSIGEFSVDLKNWLDRQPLKYAHKPTRIERIGYWIQRNRTATLALVIAGVLAVLGMLLWSESIKKQESEEARRNETLHNTQFDVRLVSWILERELERVKQAVDRAGKTPELRNYLMENDLENLQKYVGRIAEDNQMTWGGPLPIEHWVIYDAKGKMLAHSFAPELVGEDFSFRDYMKRALGEALESGGTPGYVSRLYHSQSQGFFKFAIAQAVRAEGSNGEIIGVITTSITTSRTMGLQEILDPRYKVVLVGRWDPNPAPGEPTPSSHFLIVLHPSYPEVQKRRVGEPPAEPIPFPEELEHVLHGGTFEDYRDPVANEYPEYNGRWLAVSAPVKGTEFVVIVQVRPEN